MIPGRTLLLADDSVAIQKVIDLTFTDEGMQVITAGDGQDALEKLNQFKPDVVLADIYMPGVNGYELCKHIKQSDQFHDVPVMLLVGSFEPFDEAEAKRAGADDVVTKPFQSIRDLVSRVGLLVNRKHEVAAAEPGDDDSTFAVEDEISDATPEDHQGMSVADEERAEVSEGESLEQSPVKVFVEAAVMQTAEPPPAPEHACPEDIALQTADTQQLERVIIDEEDSETVEVEAVVEDHDGRATYERDDVVTVGEFQPDQLVEEESVAAAGFDDDGVLDLGDIDSFTSSEAEDDFELEVDVAPIQFAKEPMATFEQTHLAETVDLDEVAASAASEQPVGKPSAVETTDSDLSPAAIEAISRRVVEQLSERVVREIAWEVVPELSELLIKKRLDQR